MTWRSKKQPLIVRSSADVEYRLWPMSLRAFMAQHLLKKLGVIGYGSMKLYCDNNTVNNIAHNPVQHNRIRHIENNRYFIKEKLNNGLICMLFVESENQLADIFNKGFMTEVFYPIVHKLRMREIHTPT